METGALSLTMLRSLWHGVELLLFLPVCRLMGTLSPCGVLCRGGGQAGSCSGSTYECLQWYSPSSFFGTYVGTALWQGLCSYFGRILGVQMPMAEGPRQPRKCCLSSQLERSSVEGRQSICHHSPPNLQRPAARQWQRLSSSKKVRHLLQQQILTELNTQLLTTCTYKSSLLSYQLYC